VTWWCVLIGSLVTQPQLDLTPRQLVQTALLFRHSEPHVGPAVGLSILVAALAIIVAIIRDRSSSVRTHLQPIVTSPTFHKIFTVFAYLSPGLFLFSQLSVDLITRQHVERITLNSDGNVSTLIGPQLTSFLWALVTAFALGILLSIGMWFVANVAKTGKIAVPRFRTSYLGLLALALIVRLGTLLVVAPTRTDGGDPLFYHSTANFLAKGLGFPEPLNFIAYQNWNASALHGPLYPIVLSISSRLGGTTYFDHKFLSLLIGTAVVAFVGLVARRVAPNKHRNSIALIAMLFAAMYPNLWLVDGVMFPEGLMALCTTAVVYAAYRWRDSEKTGHRYAWAIAMGVLVSLSALTRGEGLLLAVLIIVPWILLRRDIPLRLRIKNIALAALASLLVLAPWFIRNSQSFEVSVPLSTNGNELFVYANCDEVYSGKYLGFWQFDCQEQLRRSGIDATGDEAEKSLFWREIGFDYAKEHIGELPKVVAARVGRQWELYRPFQNAEFAYIEGRNGDAAYAGLFMYYGLAAAALYGAFLIRKRKAGLLPLGALFISVTMTAMYAYGTTRFRVPAEPALCVLAAVGIFPLLSRIRTKFAMSDAHDESSHLTENNSFVHGGDVHISNIFRKTSRRTWASFAVVASAIAVALPALYRAVGSSMEEGFMLVFPERVIKGDIANVDFLHLYGPGSLHLLSSWMQVFGINLTAERSFGLLQNLFIVTGLMVLTRPWGKKLSTLVGLFSLIFVFTPVGLQALAWNGGVGIALWSVVFTIRAVHRSEQQLSSRTTWALSGLLAGLALTFRPDLGLALLLVFAWVLWKRPRRTVLHWASGVIVGLTSLWIHLLQAGPSAVIRGIILDPVIHLRPGRELPSPPSWSYLQGALQVISEKFAPWWGLPSLSAPKQLFIWFFMLPIVAFFVTIVAWRLRKRSFAPVPQRFTTLFVAGLLGIGLLPQAFQRPDSAHLLWVSLISWPLLLIALYEVIGMRNRRIHPTARIVTATSSLVLLILMVCPFYTVRTYTDLVWRSITGKTDVLEISRGDRYFYLGDTRPYLAASEVISDLDQLSKPGERLFVGPVDLRNTSYSDAYFYHLFPDLTPATYFIEMDPGLADTEGSGLDDEVASADWLLLTRFWSEWIEPNESTKFGPDAPNQVVENNFCLRGSYQYDLVRLYQKCSGGDNTGPYDEPYKPQYDYAVEVRVPVPPRPDGTCTPTCNGEFNPEYDNMNTSTIEP
jgi:4-amino-4-deoxy-L-arabinose transferase-like glycosyltransferase